MGIVKVTEVILYALLLSQVPSLTMGQLDEANRLCNRGPNEWYLCKTKASVEPPAAVQQRYREAVEAVNICYAESQKAWVYCKTKNQIAKDDSQHLIGTNLLCKNSVYELWFFCFFPLTKMNVPIEVKKAFNTARKRLPICTRDDEWFHCNTGETIH